MDLTARPGRGRRIAVRVALAVVLVVVAGLGAGGWYYTNELLPAIAPDAVAEDVEVIELTGDAITLRPDDPTDDLTLPTVGFQHRAGYLQLTGPAQARGDGSVERGYEVVAGTPPAVGDRGDVQVDSWPDDPSALGLPAEEVSTAGPLGELAGWWFPGDGPRGEHVVVLVHGRGARRAETLRAARLVVRDAGATALVVAYRNGDGAPASPDGFGHFGDAEWLDLQGWLEYLEERAPAGVTLYGFSQGASVVASCLRRCDDTSAVTGVILDSPLLSMQATLELQAAERDIPSAAIGPLLVATKVISTLRGGPDFANLEHVAALADLDLPILAFHGRDDTTVPFAPTRALAQADPDQVRFVAYDGGHVRGWNVDPAEYTDRVVTFLRDTR